MESAFDYIVVSTEVFSLLVCIILLYGNMFESRQKSARRRTFSVLIAVEILGLVFDILSYASVGKSSMLPMLYLGNAFSFSLTFVLIGTFGFYIYFYLSERKKVSKTLFIVCGGFCILMAIGAFIGTYTGLTAVFEDYRYYPGPYYSAYIIVNGIAMALLTIVVIANCRTLGLHDSIAAFVYILFPVGSAVANLFIPDWPAAYSATALSILVCFIVIQSEQATQFKEQGKVSYHNSTHDELTGLLNRRAYTNMSDSLESSDALMGVVFCDVNGLKYANDTYGHAAGDALLVQMAEKLCSVFRKEEIFRISGDEFVVLLPGLPESSFDDRVMLLEGTLCVDGKLLACFGTAYGSCREVGRLTNAAESQMYERKEIFHKEHPETAR